MSLPLGQHYVELHCHSAYSFLDGASAPEELARRAAELGYPALALTDHDGVWGAMEFAQACKAFGVRPIVGAELTVTPARARDEVPEDQCGPAAPSALEPGGRLDEGRRLMPFHLTLLVENATGWRNLCRLITEAHRETRPKPDREPLPPPYRWPRWSSGPRGSSACPDALARGHSRGRSSARAAGRLLPRRKPPGRWGDDWRVPSGPTASGSSCSGRSGAMTEPATAGWQVSLSDSAFGAWRVATSICMTPLGRRFRTRWSPCA